MRVCATTRSRLPPEPWLRRTAAPLRDGTYQAVWPSPIRTSWWGMPSEESWIAQRGACVIWRLKPNVTTRTPTTTTPASQPAAWAARQPSPGLRGARPRAVSATSPEATRSSPPTIMPTPVTSRRSGPEFTTCNPCEMTPKPNASEADDDAEQQARGAGHARLCERPAGGHREDREHAEDGGRRAGEREIEQVQCDQHEPGQQKRALQPGDPLAPPAPPPERRGDDGAWRGGCHVTRSAGRRARSVARLAAPARPRPRCPRESRRP